MNNLGFIHRFVPGQEGKPTLLLLHGTGGSEEDLLGLARDLAPSWALLSPRGKVSESGMARFFRRFAEGIFDLEDLRFRAGELAEFVREASGVYGFDPSRVTALGYSNGANIGAAVMLLHPEVLSGAVLLRAMVPLEPESPPDLSGKRVFLASGRRDPIVSEDQPERLAEILRRSGADVQLLWQDAGHELTSGDIEAAREFLQS